MKLKIFFTALTVLIVMTSAFADPEKATVTVVSNLYTAANSQSTILNSIKAGTEVTIERRQGAWYRVHSDTFPQSGWLRSFNVQINPNINWFNRFKRVLAGGYSTDSGATATIGIRGLGPGDVKKAAPNYQEVAVLDSYGVNLQQGMQYAATVPLYTNEIAYYVSDNPLEKAGKTMGSAAKGLGNTFENAVEGIKGLFGGKKDEE